jgi:hypothetical protein
MENEVNEVIPVNEKNLVENLRDNVQFEIKNAQEKILKQTVEQLVNQEVEVRKNLIIEGLKTYEDLKDKLSKIKPDVLGYDETGKVTSESFSKAKVDEKIKLEKQFKEIESALNLAMTNGDYKKLQKK